MRIDACKLRWRRCKIESGRDHCDVIKSASRPKWAVMLLSAKN